LVDKLGGFWDAADIAKKLAGIPAGNSVTFKLYPRQKGMWESIQAWLGNDDEVEAIENFNTLMHAPAVGQVVRAVKSAPRANIELRATNLPD
jgi:protease-4